MSYLCSSDVEIQFHDQFFFPYSIGSFKLFYYGPVVI